MGIAATCVTDRRVGRILEERKYCDAASLTAQLGIET
jgi:hypothetical protein